MSIKSTLVVDELKPLYANLKRLRIGEYLHTEEFRYNTIENQSDDLWDKCLRAAKKDKTVIVARYHDINEEEDAFLIFMSSYYRKSPTDLLFMVLGVLMSFAKWNPIRINFNPIYNNLDQLGYKDKYIEEFQSKVSKVMRGKPKTIEAKEVKITSTPVKTNNVFVVHGWADVDRLEVFNLLKDEFKLTPIVMQDQPNESIDTIIGKFERLAKDCSMAIILFTPDDKVGDKTRARQNVILELGYFLGKFQDPSERKIIILKKGDIEIPSDIQGVLYFSYNKSVNEIYLPLKKQLNHWGYKV